jgi:hypothetical protein
MKLRGARAISVGEYDQLYGFLDHERLGLARGLYAPDTYRRRASKSRELGLEVPADRETFADGDAVDVRALCSPW